ncbi:hypothetical protein DUI87_22379 [Hirundo rustica rustica]|uniref:GRAM domain-containing protein n=1 Tax=Hirundo rustica rustica TaxID=333673 RepID=A0A3M0JJM7_HIRRU|nr:hypothetical protein DUI87_22379 [Hirundo rustica rustica]
MGKEEPSEIQANARSCTWRKIIPCSSTGWRPNLLGSSSVEKDLGVPGENKLSISQQRVLAAEQTDGILGCIQKSTVSKRRMRSFPSLWPRPSLESSDFKPWILIPAQNYASEPNEVVQLKANTHFHKLFLDVPIDEPLKQSFTCALQKEILYQGKLFLSENWICFHSKVFGKDTKISIPVLSVTLLKKTKTALLVPNALIIATVTDRDFNEDYSDLDGIVQQRRQEMEESSSTGSQTPELECFQDYHVVEAETHLKVSKPEAKSVRSDAHSKRGPDGKAQNGHSEAFRFLHKVKSQKLLSLNHVLVFYAILVCVLILSTFYMRYKISVLEERLMSMTAFDSHIKERQVNQDLGSHLQINADALCDELTANLRKLEKCQQD